MNAYKEPTDANVAEFAEQYDCSTLEARHELRAEALAVANGEQINYRFEEPPRPVPQQWQVWANGGPSTWE